MVEGASNIYDFINDQRCTNKSSTCVVCQRQRATRNVVARRSWKLDKYELRCMHQQRKDIANLRQTSRGNQGWY